ncbi:MAG: hypothetical protein ACI4S0_07425 [Dorea sp.]
MPEYRYDIMLETQLGDKSGELMFQIDGNSIEGVCTVLGFSVPCRGMIDQKGNCTLTGQIKTFMTTYDYIGAGYVDHDRVDLVLNSGKKRFYLTGTAFQKK